MNYLIIGNSAAAVGTVEGIRSVDAQSKITIVSDEKYHTYSRPLISYYLEGKVDLQKMKYRPDDFYEKNDVELITGIKAEKINVEKKSVLLSDGRDLLYDKLCVCTGSSPFLPAFKGIEMVSPHFSFMTLDDALSLEKALTPNSRVFIIGAGLIGLKCAEGISARCRSVTVTDLSDRVLSSVLDEKASELVAAHLEKSGIKLLLGNSVSEFSGNTAIMKNGETVDFDILVTAVGVRANTALIKDAGGETGRGITVNTQMKTSLPDIYAAGDCCEEYDISADNIKLISILPDAYLGGETAGINMAGGKKAFTDSIPMNSIGFFGLHIMTAGAYTGEIYKAEENRNLKELFFSDNRLNGFILVGDTDKAGIYTSLIRNQTPLSSIDFELVKQDPTLIAFERDERKTKLGGEV